MVSVDEIIELDKHSHDKKETIKLPSMKMKDALYIAINALNPIGERYTLDENDKARLEIHKLYNFLYGTEDFSISI